MRFLSILLLAATCACAAKPPVPLVVLENPATGQRAQFFREVPFKVPANYDEAKHIADWRAEKTRAGFTVEIETK